MVDTGTCPVTTKCLMGQKNPHGFHQYQIPSQKRFNTQKRYSNEKNKHLYTDLREYDTCKGLNANKIAFNVKQSYMKYRKYQYEI